MKEGDKIFCISNDLLRKNKYYYFVKYDTYLNDDNDRTGCIYVKDEKNQLYYAPLSNFLDIKMERKLKLQKINGKKSRI